jgi:hypothetical protein
MGDSLLGDPLAEHFVLGRAKLKVAPQFMLDRASEQEQQRLKQPSKNRETPSLKTQSEGEFVLCIRA